jgi:anti-sigma factor RsiW
LIFAGSGAPDVACKNQDLTPCIMFCDEALEAIEPIAAGEMTPPGRIAQHLVSCAHCAATLDSARRLDHLLQLRSVPKPPVQFTARTMARVRRARWRTEQFLDAGFNLALCFIVFGVVLSVLLLMFRSGLLSVTTDVFALAESGLLRLARRFGQAFPLYGSAAAIVFGALAIWWWAERDAS